jgi:hypothetical protein
MSRLPHLLGIPPAAAGYEVRVLSASAAAKTARQHIVGANSNEFPRWNAPFGADTRRTVQPWQLRRGLRNFVAAKRALGRGNIPGGQNSGTRGIAYYQSVVDFEMEGSSEITRPVSEHEVRRQAARVCAGSHVKIVSRALTAI